ncbi:MAG: polysaccharide biosynthesis tyrosine autokinase [Myxococcales bacterium]
MDANAQIQKPLSPAALSPVGPVTERRFEFRAVWRVFRQRWPVAVVVGVLVVGGVAAWTYKQPRIYESTCSIVIETMAPQVLQVKDVVELGTGSFWANREFYETQFRIMRSTDVMQRVAEKVGQPHDVRNPDAKRSPREVAEALAGQMKVANLRDSRIANITFADRDPERAALLANTLADTYIEYNLEFKLEGARSATTWLGQEGQSLRKRLEKSELALFEFRKNKNLLAVGLDDKQSMTSKNLDALNMKLSEITIKRAELEAVRKLILDARGDISEKETIPEIRNNATVQHLRTLYLDLEKQKADLASKYGDQHPRIENISQQIASVRAEYEREIDGVLKTMDKAYQALLNIQNSLEKHAEQEKREAIELSKMEVQYKPLQREAEDNNRVFALITTRQKEIDLTGMMKTNNVRVLDRATVNRVPVSPKVGFNLIIGALIGLLGGIGAAFGMEAFDNTLKSQEDVELAIGRPVVGIIPMIKAIDEKKVDESASALQERDLSVIRNPKSPAAECCRSLRTNLLFMSPDHPLHTIVVTSPGPQEGKTTTAINLAVTFALAGNKVLLIDTDMRRPRVHRSFGISNTAGLSTAILGAVSIRELAHKTEIENLEVVPCGPTPPNPAELIHTEKFANLLRECTQYYDRVILDSPPTSAVTDPVVLGTMVDGVLLVVRANRTTREAAAQARRQLATANANLIGVVINEVEAGDGYGGYSYYYRSYGGYGGYYGHPEEESAKA